jgi:hypothetical protein
MNERIKELALQSGAVPLVGHGGLIISNLNVEKFAELIVRECVSVMKSTVDESIDFDRKLDETSSWIESDIKRHFGVE